MERVYLAQKLSANGNDSSTFVLAILTDETIEATADAIAEATATENSTRLMTAHDGKPFYRVVRPSAQAKAAGAFSKME
jgi:hypothetical protein